MGRAHPTSYQLHTGDPAVKRFRPDSGRVILANDMKRGVLVRCTAWHVCSPCEDATDAEDRAGSGLPWSEVEGTDYGGLAGGRRLPSEERVAVR